MIRGLLAKADKLRLTNGGDSAAEQFSFRFYMKPPPAARTQPCEVIATVAGKSVGLLVVGGDGLAYCYITDGLMVALDHDKPGQLLMHTGREATFSFGGKDGGTGGAVGYQKEVAQPSVVADPAGALGSLVDRITQGEVDQDGRRISVRTARGAAVTLKLAGSDAPYPLETVLIQAPNGLAVGFGDVKVGAALRQLIGITAADVNALGLPVRVLSDEEVRRFSVLPPTGFGQAKEEREAAATFQKLRPAGAATRRS